MIAGVIGRPIDHSLSPVLHNAWIAHAKLDAAYVPLQASDDGFRAIVNGFRGGVVRGLNVTIPFKEMALALADRADGLAQAAGAANVLIFLADGTVEARNTDGVGLLAAFKEQAPHIDLRAGPVVVMGAGGAARGAAAALRAAGRPELRIVNRTVGRAQALADRVGGRAFDLVDAGEAFADCRAIINATPSGSDVQDWPLHVAPIGAAVMDMVYRPLVTPLLQRAVSRGMPVVDGLSMLIHQAIPSFEAFFGRSPPPLDARALLLGAMG